MRKQIDIEDSMLNERLEKLTLMERSVWLMASVEGFSAAEISEITGLSEREAGAELEAARQKMKAPVFAKMLFFRMAAAATAGLLFYMFWVSQSQTQQVEFASEAPQKIRTESVSPQEPILTTLSSSKPNSPKFSAQPAPQHKEKKTLLDPKNAFAKDDELLALVMRESNGVGLNLSPRRPDLLSPLNSMPAPQIQSGSKTYIISPSEAIAANMVIAQDSTPKLFQKMRQALVPRSFANPDERISISLQLPSIFLAEKD